MDYAAAADALMRRKLLEEIYDRMTDDEKRLFVQMTLQQKSSGDIMKAIGEQSSQLAELRRRQQALPGHWHPTSPATPYGQGRSGSSVGWRGWYDTMPIHAVDDAGRRHVLVTGRLPLTNGRHSRILRVMYNPKNCCYG